MLALRFFLLIIRLYLKLTIYFFKMMKKLALLGLTTSMASALSINIGAKVGADFGGIWDRSENFTYLDANGTDAYFGNETLSQKKRCSTRGRPYFGFTIGTDYHIQHYFIGIEGEVGYRLNSKNNMTGDTFSYFNPMIVGDARETTITIHQKATLRLGIVGRLGMEIFKNTSIYGLLGLNFQRMNYQAQVNDSYTGRVTPQSFHSAPSRAYMRPGIVYGIGIQYKVHKNMSVGLEGRWTRLKAASYAIDNPAPGAYAAASADAVLVSGVAPQGSEKLSGSYKHSFFMLQLNCKYHCHF
jgi:opacity protein-like surface antigen